MKRIVFLFLLFSLLLTPTAYSRTLEFKSWQIWDFSYNGIHQVCCSVSAKDGDVPVTGLSIEDFAITETLVDEFGNVLSKAEIAPYQREDQFGGIGFWERSVSSSKIDLVFLIDKTGSMAGQIESIKSELKEFVNRLEDDSCDFRVAVLLFEASSLEEPGRKSPDHPFHGVMERDELLLAIEEIETAGEWHINTWSYDAILFGSQLDFREDARAVIVVITDTLPETVYGPFWYFSGGSVATKRAVEIALEERGIELEYFQPEESALAHMENYDRLINPALSESNFNYLAGAVSLGWPFKQDLIEVDALPVSESIYYLSWESALDEITKYYRKQGFEVEVNVRRGDEQVSFKYSPFFDEEGYLQSSEDYHLPVFDEEGSALPDKVVEMDLLRELGDLKAFSDSNWNYVARDGVLQLRSVDPGEYLYRLYGYGRSSYSYSTLRLRGSGEISFVQGEVFPDSVVAQTGDAFLESVKIRGLMEEFVGNKIAVNESKEFAEKSLHWIDAISSDGLNLREMEAMKRFYVSVGAFLNGTAYAAIESERVESDLLQMVRDTRRIVEHAEEVADMISSAKNIILSTASIIADIISGNWSGVAQQISIEALLDEFVSYVKNDLLDDVLEAVKNKLRAYLSDPSKAEELLSLVKGDMVGWVEGGEDSDEGSVRDEIRQVVYTDLTYRNFTKPVIRELEESLAGAARLASLPISDLDLYAASWSMNRDFANMRTEVMDPLQDWSFMVLGEHKRIDNWETILEIFEETVPLIVELLRLMEYKNPVLGDIAEELSKLSYVLDAVGLLTLAYEISLKADQLTTMAGKLDRVNDYLFPEGGY